MQDSGKNNYRSKPRHEGEITDSMGKLPPHDLELEATLLGELMLERDAFLSVSDMITAESFYEPRHQKIYQAIADLSYNQRPIDLLTVTDQLRQNGALEEVGGALFVSELTMRAYSAAHVLTHAQILSQKFLARQLIKFSTNLSAQAFDETNDVDDLLNAAEGELFRISQTKMKREAVQIDSLITEAVKQIEAAKNSNTGISGLRTGFKELDRITSGWQNSDLVIIAARPAMGKTAFVLSMAKLMAIDYSIPVAIFTLEMSALQLVNRILSNVANIPGEAIKSGNIENFEQLNAATRPLFGAPLFVDENPGLSIADLRTKARRLVMEHGIKIIMIDYLQLMNASGMKFGSREQEVSMISRNLKALAKELNIPIIALSQLNRSTENREDKRPVLSDLRESGAIEQDADIVCFIHRQEYYTRSKEDSNGKNIEGMAELIIAKHRSGAVGTVDLRFANKFARFEDPESTSHFHVRKEQPVKMGSRLNDERPQSEYLSDPGTGEIPENLRPDPGEDMTDNF